MQETIKLRHNGSRTLCTSKAVFLYSQVLSIHKYKPMNKLVWRQETKVKRMEDHDSNLNDVLNFT